MIYEQPLGEEQPSEKPIGKLPSSYATLYYDLSDCDGRSDFTQAINGYKFWSALWEIKHKVAAIMNGKHYDSDKYIMNSLDKEFVDCDDELKEKIKNKMFTLVDMIAEEIMDEIPSAVNDIN